jgi:hypothetical protein
MIIDVRAHPGQVRKYRAFLDGVDVTAQCFYADDIAGIIRRNKLNAEGQIYADPPFVLATEELHGHVVIQKV